MVVALGGVIAVTQAHRVEDDDLPSVNSDGASADQFVQGTRKIFRGDRKA